MQTSRFSRQASTSSFSCIRFRTVSFEAHFQEHTKGVLGYGGIEGCKGHRAEDSGIRLRVWESFYEITGEGLKIQVLYMNGLGLGGIRRRKNTKASGSHDTKLWRCREQPGKA